MHDPDALVLQPRRDVLDEDVGVPVHQLLGALGDQRQLLADGQAVGGADGQPGALPALEPGDAHHVELVEVAGEDRQELHPLQQRQRLVLGQLQHPGVEVQPGQLPVQEAVGRQGRGPGRDLGGHRVIVPYRGETATRARRRADRVAEARARPRAGRLSGVDVPGQARPAPGQRHRAPGPVRRRRARGRSAGAARSRPR